MKGNVFRFRTLKHGDPDEKFKMLAEDIGEPRWRVWLRRYGFYGLAALCFAAGVIGMRFIL